MVGYVSSTKEENQERGRLYSVYFILLKRRKGNSQEN
jgi:hypothetical protein